MDLDNKIPKIIAIFTIAAFIIGAVLVFVPLKSGGSLENGEFIVEKGQSLGETARRIDERGLIISRYLFIAYAILSGHERDFKAGRYMITGPVSTRKLVYIFSRGLSEPEDVVVTIPEGSNATDINKLLAKAGLIKSGEFLEVALQYEGYLFPDTYRLRNCQSPTPNCQLTAGEVHPERSREGSQRAPASYGVQPQEPQEVEPLNTGVREIIQKMRENFEAKTGEIFRNLSTEEKERIVVIASMLEKEVRTEQDMRLVAGIMEKRLKLGMPLEIDATVAYSVCRQKFLLGEYCDVSLANIVDNIPVDSTYNTYRRKSLPAGPISNPGLVSLQAALNPQSSDYLYYLSAKDGTTIFSKTAEEHAKARQKHIK